MVFLVQSGVNFDFCFELRLAKEYYDWLGKETLEIRYEMKDNNPDRYIPIGSVEFVSEYLNKFYPSSSKALLPINVPTSLFKFCKRKISNSPDIEGIVFRKSNLKIKHPDNGIGPALPGFQISELVRIESEWRVFIFHKEILYIANYSGDPLLFPDSLEIKKMVQEYNDSPVAYTLDVGVSQERGTFVIECHRFFSCGLYGFSDHAKIPKMFSQCWYEMKNIK
ncbi:MAG: ATP-grasp domain-containing protein [Bacilli bacterium]|nr:ATP-grasp domain-containing protein [Bacilli bacterium]